MREVIDHYLGRRGNWDRELTLDRHDGIDQVVVIPVLAERETLPRTLESLAKNAPKLVERTAVLCVVNNRVAEIAGTEVVAENRETLAWLRDGADGSPLRLGWIDASSAGRELGAREGVGTARKLGMDWALRLLREEGKGRGAVICLDGDTLVEPNYLGALRNYFEGEDARGAVVEYAHPIEGSVAERSAIAGYEIWLRYYVLGLRHVGSPYGFHTIGSAMACTGEAYAAVSGMNRRQAGEDFYFLQKLAKTGRVACIGETVVRPSPRPSWRVPFGTGRRVQGFLDGAGEYRLYHPGSFAILNGWLGLISEGRADGEGMLAEAEGMAPALGEYLRGQGFAEAWRRMAAHSGSGEALAAQGHRWFDGFRTLKCLHGLRDGGHGEVPMAEGLRWVLEVHGVEGPELEESLGVEEQVGWLEVLRGLCRTAG